MRHVIVGASAAGMAAAGAIRKRSPQAEIIMLSDEVHAPYFRPLITYLIYGEKEAHEIIRQPHLMPDNLDLRLNTRATSLDPEVQTLQLANGEILTYDRLLLATGASPVRPKIDGLDGSGVFVLRTWDDALGIAALSKGAKHALILGAGRIGMKSAFALCHLGLSVTVVELLERIVPQQLDNHSAALFAERVKGEGIETIVGHTLKEVHRQNGKVAGGVLDNGRQLRADLIILGVGVKANLELARSAGLKFNDGLLVDKSLRTSDAHIFAAGDVVETNDIVSGKPVVSGIWTNAAEMGNIAGNNMAGGNFAYQGAFSLLNAMELGGLPVVSVGEIQAEPGGEIDIFTERRGDNYRKLVFRENRLVGLILVGEIERAGLYQTLIREGADVSTLRSELLGRKFHYGHYIQSQPKKVDRYTSV